MSHRVGLDLTADRIRAVTVGGWRSAPLKSFEIRWDPRAPIDAVNLLKRELGQMTDIAISAGLAFTSVKNVKLPPVSADERRSILTLEPDRFFAIEAPEIVVSIGGSDLVFASAASVIESWIAAFETWAPVSVVEPSARSLARVLSAAGVRSGVFSLPAGPGETGIAEIQDGGVKSARRFDEQSSVGQVHAAPEFRGVAPDFLVAFGAALGFDSSLDGMLLPPADMTRVRKQRRSRLVRAAANCLLALVFASAGLDRSRSNVLEAEQREIATLSSRAEGPAALRARIAQMDLANGAAANAASAHADPVAVLAAISRRLPRDAVAMSVRADGDEWQVDGTAINAASVVPALDADPSLENVRFLSASSRFTEGNRTYETFSVAFHARR